MRQRVHHPQSCYQQSPECAATLGLQTLPGGSARQTGGRDFKKMLKTKRTSVKSRSIRFKKGRHVTFFYPDRMQSQSFLKNLQKASPDPILLIHKCEQV